MEIQVGMLVCCWGLSRGWNNVTDQVLFLESRNEQWLFRWLEWALSKVVKVHSQAKQALVWSGSEQVGPSTARIYVLVRPDHRLAANGHTMLNACHCFYDVELQRTITPDERHFQYREVSQKWRLWYQAGQNKKDVYNNGIYILCLA